jgi:glycosyltransferase involved in cell wall biosynthesis
MARICMVAYTDYAGDTRIRREAEALVARGDTVDLVCPLTDSLRGKTSLDDVNLHFARSFQYGGSGPIRYLLRYAAFLFAAARRVGRLQRRQPIDVVQVHTMPDFLVFAAWPAKRRGARVILDVHDLVPELYESKFGLRETHPIIRLLTWVERRSIAFADAAIAVHRPHRDALVRHGSPPEKLVEVMNTPDLRLVGQPRTEAEIDQSLLVYHGTVSKRHGLETAVRALALARNEEPNLSLFIAGEGDDLDRIERLVDELGLEDAVTVRRGFSLLEELLPTLRRAGGAVIPLIPDSFTRYMLPVKLLEYAAMHIPVIVTRTPTIEAYFDDASVMFAEPEDPGALARLMVELYRDPGRKRSLVSGAAEVIAQHSWEQERRRYLGIVDQLVARRVSGEVQKKRLRIEV